MEKFPLRKGETPAGELRVSRESLYTWFEADSLRQEGLWCAWIVGERGQLRLGVLEPSGGRASIRRRFSHHFTDPLGKLLWGEIRPAAEEVSDWTPVPAPEKLFRAPWLCRQVQGLSGVLVRSRGQGRQIAFPYEKDRPFPIPGLFCLSALASIRAGRYVVLAFDGEERPVFEL